MVHGQGHASVLDVRRVGYAMGSSLAVPSEYESKQAVNAGQD